MKKFLPVIVLLLYSAMAIAQNIVQAEYFIDTDAGVGNNKLLALTNPQQDGIYNLNIDLTGLSVGYHKLHIRTKDGEGKWSFTARRNIEIISSNIVKKIIGGEYFFDNDPGFSLGNNITITTQDTAILQNFMTATNNLSTGYHKLYIRLKDNDGNWSITTRRNIEIIKASTYVITGAEYFFTDDPGVGSATPVLFNAVTADSSFTFKIPISQIPSGSHTLYVRAKDSINKNWSITQTIKDSVVTSIRAGNWSDPATWSNSKIPDANTVVLLYHNVDVDIVNAICKSLTPYRNSVICNVMAGKRLKITGNK